MLKYHAIAEEIVHRIEAGVYTPGQKIPSMRAMAAEFGCNKLTVQKAFERLKQEGYLENRVGSGSFVRFPERIRQPGEVFDFRSSYLSERFFPHAIASEIFRDLLAVEKGAAFSLPDVAGEPSFLAELGRFYHLPTRQMIVLSGAPQGLDLTAKAFATRTPEDILFEDPTYPGAISRFRARRFVPLEGDGPDLEKLEAALADPIRLFYAMPAIHNPTGITYSPEKKKAVCRLARAHDFFIIEDDYLGEFQEAPSPRFVDLLPERTLHIKSLSQATAPGLRLGFMVVPEPFFDKFLYEKYTSDVGANGLLQKFFREFVRCGAFGRHIGDIRKRMAARRGRLLALLSEYPALSLPGGQQGNNLWIRSSSPITLAQVPWTPGGTFSFSPEYRHCARISFMNMDDAVFEEAVGYLKACLDRL